jgi:hypothetical protein
MKTMLLNHILVIIYQHIKPVVAKAVSYYSLKKLIDVLQNPYSYVHVLCVLFCFFQPWFIKYFKSLL